MKTTPELVNEVFKIENKVTSSEKEMERDRARLRGQMNHPLGDVNK